MGLTMGQLIRIARRQARLSQNAVAAQLGVAQVFYGKVEQGKKHLAVARWTRLIEVLPTLKLPDLVHARVEAAVTIEVHACRLTEPSRAQLEAILIEDALNASHAAKSAA